MAGAGKFDKSAWSRTALRAKSADTLGVEGQERYSTPFADADGARLPLERLSIAPRFCPEDASQFFPLDCRTGVRTARLELAW
ncbi:MAG: hypothetical protein KatS3mg077_0813 [Candidatus Binatia bacterium]|nr:MAG: hypothetical protein KatS3mg077_0813 [Candidatus Binatia bacterium]